MRDAPFLDAAALVLACRQLDLYALCQGAGVRAWLPEQGDRWPIPDGALWVLPGCDGGGGRAWLWEQGGRRGSHPRRDIAGAADAVAAFLRAVQERR